MVCVECEEKGHKSIHPPLRVCEKCIDEQKQCFKVVVIFYSADSESKNKSAGEIFNQEKEKEDPNPLMLLCVHIPDTVHVGKRYHAGMSNWFLLVDGFRVNIVLLRTLEQDPQLKELQSLRLAGVRNRDRINVDTMLEVNSDSILKVLSFQKIVVQTIVPEKYRLYDNNSPIALCLGPYGKVLLVDTDKGTLLSARLHYPVDVTELAKGLKVPKPISYKSLLVAVAESAPDRVVVVDTDCQTLLYTNLMSVKQIEGALKKRKALPPGRKLKRAPLFPLLQKWIAANRKKEKE